MHLRAYYSMLRAAGCQTQADKPHLVCHTWIQVYHPTTADIGTAEHEARLRLMETRLEQPATRAATTHASNTKPLGN